MSSLQREVCIAFYPCVVLHGKYLTPKYLEMHGCASNTVVTDALVLKHQAIGIHSGDKIIIVLNQLHMKTLHLQ